MGLKLNKYFFLFVVLIFALTPTFSQNEREYKDSQQFKNFRKRSQAVTTFQIRELKKGALVVRLKTNQLLVNALLKSGDTILANEKQLEMAGTNVNLMKAFLNAYDFSKVYFIYPGSSDSLIKGARSNIFLDTNLRISPAILMNESFYLLAEKDYAYNSSIGFVKEDTAKFIKEEGYGVKEMAVVVKNKYGHQLKKPFPYFAAYRPDIKIEPVYVSMISINGTPIPFNIGGFGKSAIRNSQNDATFMYQGKRLTTHIPKYLTYQRLSISIGNFNEELKLCYKKYGNRDTEKMNEEVKSFLY